MYDDIADIYLEIFPLNQAFLDFLPDYLGYPGSAVLDLGCGPGDYVDYLSRSGYCCVGIDSSTVMIKHAQEKRQGTFLNLSFNEINQVNGAYSQCPTYFYRPKLSSLDQPICHCPADI